MRKTTHNILQVTKDVPVIKFKVVQNQHLGPVVDEFTPFVKKGGVILIPFNDKGGLFPTKFIPGG